jgi:hypothetical protein
VIDILHLVDYRSVSITILAVVLIVGVIIGMRTGRPPRLLELFHAAEACGIIVSGMAIGIVFLLTDPPAVELLSNEMRIIAGLCGLLVSVHVGIGIFARVLKPRRVHRRRVSSRSAGTTSTTSTTTTTSPA